MSTSDLPFFQAFVSPYMAELMGRTSGLEFENMYIGSIYMYILFTLDPRKRDLGSSLSVRISVFLCADRACQTIDFFLTLIARVY